MATIKMDYSHWEKRSRKHKIIIMALSNYVWKEELFPLMKSDYSLIYTA